MKTTFDHNFKATGIIDVDGINGYTQALKAVYKHIAEVTAFKPENRYIDAVPLLDKIEGTMYELKLLLKQAQEDLKRLTDTEKDLLTQEKLS
jgi:hypothetical protein